MNDLKEKIVEIVRVIISKHYLINNTTALDEIKQLINELFDELYMFSELDELYKELGKLEYKYIEIINNHTPCSVLLDLNSVSCNIYNLYYQIKKLKEKQ